MVTLRNRAPIKHAQARDEFEVAGKEENGETAEMSDYEQSRKKRIKENLERMQKLGILDLSLKLKSLNKPTPKSTPSIRTTLHHSTPIPPPGPRRRSSRLQNATPVNYSEVHLSKKDGPLEDEHDLLREEGSKPEFYTEEHEKLLGSTEMSWTLFVDGYGRDGKRIYDPVNGKTCHQCRQKTLGHRTHCSKCNKVQGQFCGDCLYMRYGEHVLEANQNPNWICPVCRDICNCSLCRQAKGWPPTGPLYRKISSFGFKSVAHYIIQTRRKNSDLEATSDIKVPISVKRSLPFSNTETTLVENESFELKTNSQGLGNEQSEGQMTDNCIDVGKQEEKPYLLDNENGDCKLDRKNDSEVIMQVAFATNGNPSHPEILDVIRNETDLHDCSNILLGNSTESLNKPGIPNTSFYQKRESKFECGTSPEKLEDKREDEIFRLGGGHVDCFAAPESSPNSEEKQGDHTNQISADIIAGRLRQRRNKGNEHEEQMSRGKAKNGAPDAELKKSNDVISPYAAETTTVKKPNSTNPEITPVATTDRIARRLIPRHGKDNEQEEERSTGTQQLNNVSSPLKAEDTVTYTDSTKPDVAPITHSKSKKKRIHVSETSPDNIAGRLRQRREGRWV